MYLNLGVFGMAGRSRYLRARSASGAGRRWWARSANMRATAAGGRITPTRWLNLSVSSAPLRSPTSPMGNAMNHGHKVKLSLLEALRWGSLGALLPGKWPRRALSKLGSAYPRQCSSKEYVKRWKHTQIKFWWCKRHIYSIFTHVYQSISRYLKFSQNFENESLCNSKLKVLNRYGCFSSLCVCEECLK